MGSRSLVVPKGRGPNDRQQVESQKLDWLSPPNHHAERPRDSAATLAAEHAARVAAQTIRQRFVALARVVIGYLLCPTVALVTAIEVAGGRTGWWLALWGLGVLSLLAPTIATRNGQVVDGKLLGGWYVTGLLILAFAGLLQWGANLFSAAALLAAAWTAAFFGGRRQVVITTVAGTAGTALAGLLGALLPVAGGGVFEASLPSLALWFASTLAVAVTMSAAGAMNLFVLRSLDRAVLNLTSSLERERAERSERERAQEELANARRVEALGRLAAGIAHDMNNALMVVLGNVSVLRDRIREDPEDLVLLDDVTRAAEDAREIVRQLLVLGSQDTKTPGVANVEDVLSRLRKPLERLLPENIDVVMHRHADAWVPLGRAELERILLNLALNARDAMEQGGVLTIDARARQNYVVIRVSDTGLGMDPETQARIFEPFFTTKEVDRGTGLGLSTVKGLLKGALGTIEVHSEVDKGSTFRMALPRVAAPSAVACESQRVTLPPSRILVVEDDPGVRSSLVRMLRADGHQTLEAENAGQAEVLIDGPNQFDLLLTDAVMPDSDVPRLIERFHAVWPQGPVIICSGWVQEELVRQGIATGDFLFLEKPFTQNTLREVIATALDQMPPIPQLKGAENAGVANR